MKNNKYSDDVTLLPLYRNKRDGLFIRKDDYFKKFLYDDILCVEASGSYCYIHFRDKHKLLVAIRLGVVEACLPESHFIRIHRGFVLSLFDIDTFVGNSLKIGEQWYPIGAHYRLHMIALLNILDRSRYSSTTLEVLRTV